MLAQDVKPVVQYMSICEPSKARLALAAGPTPVVVVWLLKVAPDA